MFTSTTNHTINSNSVSQVAAIQKLLMRMLCRCDCFGAEVDAQEGVYTHPLLGMCVRPTNQSKWGLIGMLIIVKSSKSVSCDSPAVFGKRLYSMLRDHSKYVLNVEMLKQM